MTLDQLIVRERRAQRRRLRQAALLAALVAAASVLLLGLSGWFITAAALAGASGIVAAKAFNYMLPSAGIRLLAIVRTGARYGERLASHAAAFGALAHVRPALFAAIAAAPADRALALGTGEATARLIGDVDAIETRFVRLSGPWGVAAALASGAVLTLLGGIGSALVTMACAAAVLILCYGLARRMEAAGAAVQRSEGALREQFSMLVDAAPELRCFGLEPWAAERIDAHSRTFAAARLRHAKALLIGGKQDRRNRCADVGKDKRPDKQHRAARRRRDEQHPKSPAPVGDHRREVVLRRRGVLVVAVLHERLLGPAQGYDGCGRRAGQEPRDERRPLRHFVVERRSEGRAQDLTRKQGARECTVAARQHRAAPAAAAVVSCGKSGCSQRGYRGGHACVEIKIRTPHAIDATPST